MTQRTRGLVRAGRGLRTENTGGARIKELEYKYVDQYAAGDGPAIGGLIYEIKERGAGMAYDLLDFYHDEWGG